MMVASARSTRSRDSTEIMRPRDRAIPVSTPIPAPSVPRNSASRNTNPMIWRRLAPTVRSSPISRVRSTTVMEKVL